MNANHPVNNLSALTRAGLARHSGCYVDKDHDEEAFIARTLRENGLETMLRFDIGKNTDGFSPLVREALERDRLADAAATNVPDYPDNQHRELRAELARRFGLSPDMFLLSSGLEAMIDHVARAVLDPGDRYLLPVPNFSLFEDHSDRAGGVALTVPLRAPDHRWTGETTGELVRRMTRERPKLLWISNPVNPTGQFVDLREMERLVRAARVAGCLLVVDEAYGDYTDTAHERVSAARFVPRNPHLLVFRTFSKLYGLPSARVGYLMCSSPEILRAVRLHQPIFPISWFSLHMALLAVRDDGWLEESRLRLARRKAELFRNLEGLRAFEALPTDVNIFMLRHRDMGADELLAALARRGILTANIDRVSGIEGRGYLRVTVRSGADNQAFAHVCRELDTRYRLAG